MSKIRILHEDCDAELADDKSLPCNAYLITYVLDGQIKYDISSAAKQVDLFDHYWDNYRSDLKTIKQSAGTVSPKLWSPKK